MKLYAWTHPKSLPRMALNGMPAGFPLYGSLLSAAESAFEDQSVVLEVDVSALDEILGIDGDWVEAMASDASEDAASEAEVSGKDAEKAAEEAYGKVYDEAHGMNEKGVEAAISFAEWLVNQAPIPTSRITVLGHPKIEGEYDPADPDMAPEVAFDSAPKPLKDFKQLLVTRLMRSIFLPKPKLYGAGKKRGPSMGFLSRFMPKREEVAVEDQPAPDVVGGIPLVWSAGKTFRRGMRGAFGDEAGDAVAQLVAMRAGQEPGKFLGSGAKGAVYALGKDRVVKVTMDGNEVAAAANLIGVRHPNLSLVHDAFVVTDGEKGAGIIVRASIDTTLDKFDKKASKALDLVMDEVLESSQGKINAETFADIDPAVIAEEVEMAIETLRFEGCEEAQDILLDLADAFRALRHFGILGIDFDSRNIGVIKKPKPRVVIFDYGMTKSPAVEVEVVSLESLRA